MMLLRRLCVVLTVGLCSSQAISQNVTDRTDNRTTDKQDQGLVLTTSLPIKTVSAKIESQHVSSKSSLSQPGKHTWQSSSLQENSMNTENHQSYLQEFTSNDNYIPASSRTSRRSTEKLKTNSGFSWKTTEAGEESDRRASSSPEELPVQLAQSLTKCATTREVEFLIVESEVDVQIGSPIHLRCCSKTASSCHIVKQEAEVVEHGFRNPDVRLRGNQECRCSAECVFERTQASDEDSGVYVCEAVLGSGSTASAFIQVSVEERSTLFSYCNFTDWTVSQHLPNIENMVTALNSCQDKKVVPEIQGIAILNMIENLHSSSVEPSMAKEIIMKSQDIFRHVSLTGSRWRKKRDHVEVQVWNLTHAHFSGLCGRSKSYKSEVIFHVGDQDCFRKNMPFLFEFDHSSLHTETVEPFIVATIYNKHYMLSQEPFSYEDDLSSHVLVVTPFPASLHDFNVTVLFRNPYRDNTSLVIPSCLYYDLESNASYFQWSTKECLRTRLTKHHLTCSCSRFGVFGASFRKKPTLMSLFRIGLFISITALSLTIVTYCILPSLQSRINFVIVQLSLALLALNIMMVSYFKDTGNKDTCLIAALVVHTLCFNVYFWLSAKTILLFLCVKRFNSLVEMSRWYIIGASAICWLVPVFMTGITYLSAPHYFGSRKGSCWLKDDGFYYAFCIPFGILCIVDTTLFIFTCVQTTVFWRSSKMALRPHLKKELKFQSAMSVILFLLTSAAWLSGIVARADKQHNNVFSYLFAILYSFQGFLIFLFHVTCDSRARGFWRFLCSCFNPTGAISDKIVLQVATGRT